MDKTNYVLNKKPEPASNETVWAFDLGKGSIGSPGGVAPVDEFPGEAGITPRGEAVRRGNEFLHKASLLIPAEFEKDKTSKVTLAGFVLETLFYAACPHGEQQACQFRSRFALSNFVLIPDV